MRRWAPFLWKEPNGLLAGSCWFVLTALPILTFGPAYLALTHYMRARRRGERVTWKQACSFAFRTCGIKGWLMGLSDGIALLLALGCAIFILEGELPLPGRFLYMLMFVLDLLYLLSGIYRYPALNAEPGTKLSMLIVRGVLLAWGNLGWTLMFSFAQLLALLVSAVTGVGIFILYPAAAALLAACAYDEMIKIYLPEKEEEEEEEF